jgi:PEP-CTERM motif
LNAGIGCKEQDEGAEMKNRNSLRRFRTLGLAFAVAIVLSQSISSLALAIPVTYSFTTASASQPLPPFASPPSLALIGLSVSGSFTYDADGAFLGGNATTSAYAGFSSLTGTIGGYSFSDSSGLVTVQNDTYAPQLPPALPQPTPNDLFLLSAEIPNGGDDYDLTGFDVAGYTLVNVRLFWIEEIIGAAPDFLDSSALPSALPTFSGRLALDFVPAPYTPVEGQPLPTPPTLTYVFFDGLMATPVNVPEPESLPLLALGLVGVTFARRRNRTA